ncbi:MAG: hypothetical protein IT495_13350 [Gammaproteobacteria bacterium]|nr:hypothetical protein [Gammaproteobacteria bacterium]
MSNRVRTIPRLAGATLAAALAAAPIHAQEPFAGIEMAQHPLRLTDLKAAARTTAAGLTSIPNGPQVAVVTPDDLARSCEELYYERTVLMQRTNSFAPAYYDDPRNQAAAFLGTVFTPMYYLMGYTAFESYYDSRRVEAVNRRLDALRQVSAQKDCFVRR